MLKKLAMAVVIVALGAAGGCAAGRCAARQNAGTAIAGQVQTASVYDRIMASHTLRCAYQVWPPHIIKDPNTGALSGIYYDLTEELGKQLGLKIIWAEEVGSGSIFDGFKTGRYDAVCAAIVATPERSLVADFSRPFVFVPFYLYARDGDMRFDSHYAAVNDSSVKIAVVLE